MRRIKLDNVYESPTPLEDINNLWGDIDENTGELLAIHRYNTDKGEWEPYMVSVDYIKPDGNEASVTIIPSSSELRVTNVTDSVLDYQLVQVVVPDSPFYGEVEGTQTRVNILAESILVGDSNPVDDENLPMMDIVVGFYASRNGFPFDPVNYRRCKLRIVASEDELEVDSNTKVFEGGIASVKFIKYTVKLNN